ncbi:MAG: hypothetical protein IPN42_13675, partial [Methylococcaceae bacterium]|nr:hypothetical protein [Methylococcaceae bacterium]
MSSPKDSEYKINDKFISEIKTLSSFGVPVDPRIEKIIKDFQKFNVQALSENKINDKLANEIRSLSSFGIQDDPRIGKIIKDIQEFQARVPKEIVEQAEKVSNSFYEAPKNLDNHALLNELIFSKSPIYPMESKEVRDKKL